MAETTSSLRKVQYEKEILNKRTKMTRTRKDALNKIARGMYDEGATLAVEALRLALEMYEKGSIEVVPCYLALADAHIGASKLKKAEEFLSLTNWNIVKSGEALHEPRGRMHLIYGKLYTLREKYDDALHQVANAVYHLSMEYGPEHLETSFGYFHIGTVFLAQGRKDPALAMFDKVVDIWYKFLSSIEVIDHQKETQEIENIQTYLAVEIFKRILTTRIRVLGAEHIATGEARYTLSLLFLYLGEKQSAQKEVASALSIYRAQLGDGHPSTLDVESMHTQLSHE